MTSKSSKKESVRQARKEMYRQLIFEAAERVFAEQGFDGAKMQDVAAEAGLSLGTLYAIFAGKAELFQAIHESRGQELIAHATEAASEQEDALEYVLKGVGAYVEYLLDHPDFLKIHLYEGRSWALGRGYVNEEQEKQFQEGIDMLAQAFEKGIAKGTFIDESPSLMAKLTIAAHQVMVADYLDREDSEDREHLIRQVQDHVVRAFCRPEAAKRHREASKASA